MQRMMLLSKLRCSFRRCLTTCANLWLASANAVVTYEPGEYAGEGAAGGLSVPRCCAYWHQHSRGARHGGVWQSPRHGGWQRLSLSVS